MDSAAIHNPAMVENSPPWQDTVQSAAVRAPTDEVPPPLVKYWRRHLYTLDAFVQRPPKQWLVDKTLGERDFVLLYGESGHGKTHVALDLMFACATGRMFADTFSVPRPLTVAYAAGEGIGGLPDRLRAVSTFHGTTELPLYIFTDIPQLYQPTGENGADMFLAAWQQLADEGLVPVTLDLLVLDTMHNATAGAEENSAKDAGIVQASMRRLRDALGCTVMLVHHAGKNGASERGSTAIRAACDTVLRSSKHRSGYTLACEKLKDGETWPALSYDLVTVGTTGGVRVHWQGEAPVTAKHANTNADKVLAYLRQNGGQKKTATEIADAIGLRGAATKNIHRALRTLQKAGSVQEEPPPRKGFPAQWYCE
jgi:hypothetical protein